MQTPEKNNEETSNVEREQWSAEELNEQGTNITSDEIIRPMLRGDETKGNPDDRDIVGSNKPNETPQGRGETKKTDKS